MKPGYMNVRSVNKNGKALLDFIQDHATDVMCLTETWLDDKQKTDLVTPDGNKFLPAVRTTGRGGGVAVFHILSISCTRQKVNKFSSYDLVSSGKQE